MLDESAAFPFINFVNSYTAIFLESDDLCVMRIRYKSLRRTKFKTKKKNKKKKRTVPLISQMNISSNIQRLFARNSLSLFLSRQLSRTFLRKQARYSSRLAVPFKNFFARRLEYKQGFCFLHREVEESKNHCAGRNNYPSEAVVRGDSRHVPISANKNSPRDPRVIITSLDLVSLTLPARAKRARTNARACYCSNWEQSKIPRPPRVGAGLSRTKSLWRDPDAVIKELPNRTDCERGWSAAAKNSSLTLHTQRSIYKTRRG